MDIKLLDFWIHGSWKEDKQKDLTKKVWCPKYCFTEVDVFLDADFKQILIAVKEKGPITSFRAQPMNKEIHWRLDESHT